MSKIVRRRVKRERESGKRVTECIKRARKYRKDGKGVNGLKEK